MLSTAFSATCSRGRLRRTWGGRTRRSLRRSSTRDGGGFPAAGRCRLVWARCGCMLFFLWMGRRRCLRGVFPLRGCAWSDGIWYWGDWAFYGFTCLAYGGLLEMNLGTSQRAHTNDSMENGMIHDVIYVDLPSMVFLPCI